MEEELKEEMPRMAQLCMPGIMAQSQCVLQSGGVNGGVDGMDESQYFLVLAESEATFNCGEANYLSSLHTPTPTPTLSSEVQ